MAVDNPGEGPSPAKAVPSETNLNMYVICENNSCMPVEIDKKAPDNAASMLIQGRNFDNIDKQVFQPKGTVDAKTAGDGVLDTKELTTFASHFNDKQAPKAMLDQIAKNADKIAKLSPEASDNKGVSKDDLKALGDLMARAKKDRSSLSIPELELVDALSEKPKPKK